MGELEQVSRGNVAVTITGQAVEPAMESGPGHEEVRGEGGGEPFGCWDSFPAAQDGDFRAVARGEEVAGRVGEGRSLPFVRMVSVDGDCAAQRLGVDVCPSDVTWQQRREHPDADLFVQQFTQAQDGSVTKPQAVAFVAGEVFGGLLGVEPGY